MKRMALRGRLPGPPGEVVLLLHKSTSKISVEKRAPMRARQQEVNYKLTLGAAGSVKVVSDTPPADTVGSSSMTITEALALFAALWASVLKRNGFRSKQVRYKTKATRLENYKDTTETYSSSSSSELSAERSKSGSPPARRGGGVGSLDRLAGALAVVPEDPAPVAAAA